MHSPYDGLITRRDRDPGGIVVPGASILQLVATNEIWVSAWVDETAMAGLKTGQPARVAFRSEPAKSYAGKVARLGREADREMREFVVDVRVKELPVNKSSGLPMASSSRSPTASGSPRKRTPRDEARASRAARRIVPWSVRLPGSAREACPWPVLDGWAQSDAGQKSAEE